MGSVLTIAGKQQDTLADKMAGASEAELREAFKLFDIDGDGVITIEELSSLVSKVGGNMSNADATALIKAADKDGNMGIDYSEFAKLWEALHGEAEAEIRAGFAKLDVDNSGFITKDEMMATSNIKRLGLPVPFSSPEERAATFKAMDENGDESISFDEWLAFSNREIISKVA